jgi:hypothetical protein
LWQRRLFADGMIMTQSGHNMKVRTFLEGQGTIVKIVGERKFACNPFSVVGLKFINLKI